MPTGVYVRKPRPLANPLPRFWKYVKKTPTCWLWQRGTARRGYGRFWWNGKSVVASRFIYERTFGVFPPHLFVCHRCDNPTCVRPDHLFLGTQAQNIQDAVKKGRRTACLPPPHVTGEKHGQAKLTLADVAEIRRLYTRNAAPDPSPTSLRALGRKYGVSKYAIWSIIHGKTWR